MSAFTYTLKKPLKIKLKAGDSEREETISSLSFPDPDEMTAKDMTVTDSTEGATAKAIVLIAHLSGQPPKVIERLHPLDLNEINERLGTFTLPGLATGQTGSES